MKRCRLSNNTIELEIIPRNNVAVMRRLLFQIFEFPKSTGVTTMNVTRQVSAVSSSKMNRMYRRTLPNVTGVVVL